MIYVIGTPGSAVVKIGHAATPEGRLRALQTGNPMPLAVLWTHEGGEALEGHLHASLVEYRVRGEWFDLSHTPDAVEAVRRVVAASTGDLLPRPRRKTRPRVEHCGEASGASSTNDVWWFIRETGNHFPGQSFTIPQAARRLDSPLREVEDLVARAVDRRLLICLNQKTPGGEALYSEPIDTYFYPGELG